MKTIDNEVKVGHDVTHYCGTDRYPFVVVSVINPRSIMVESKKASNHSKIDILNLSLRKDGKWREIGSNKVSWFVVHTNGAKAESLLDPHF